MRYLTSLIFATLAFTVSHAMAAPTMDIPYSDKGGKFTTLHVFPSGKQNSPVIFFIHGGGWEIGDAAHVSDKPAAFNAAGYVLVSTNYRLAPAATYPAQEEDVADALAWVYHNIKDYGGDPNRIVIIGHSSGAHLAALLGANPAYAKERGIPYSIIRGVVPLDTTFFDLNSGGRNKSGKELITGAFGTDPKVLAEASPMTYVKKGAQLPRFFIVHSNRRPSVAAAKEFGEAIGMAGGRATAYRAAGDHRAINENLGGDNPETMRVMDFIAEVTR